MAVLRDAVKVLKRNAQIAVRSFSAVTIKIQKMTELLFNTLRSPHDMVSIDDCFEIL